VIFGNRVAKVKRVEQLTLVTLQTARSWIDLIEIHVNNMGSRFVACLNRLLQQNRNERHHSLRFVSGSSSMEMIMPVAKNNIVKTSECFAV